MNNSDVTILKVKDHYELYINGTFYCSADTINEAVEEYEVYNNELREKTETQSA